MGHVVHPSCRASNGRFQAGQWTEGYELTSEHRAKCSLNATRRALTSYRKISIDGTIYPNLLRASDALGLSPRTIKRYALSDKHTHSKVFFISG